MSKGEVQRAGSIPFFIDGDGGFVMLFMKPSDPKFGGSEFQIAKGRVESGENTLEAALRETEEELGLNLSNVKWVKKCGVFLDTHHIFILEVNNMGDFSDTTFETGDTAWLTEEEFSSIGRKLHRPIVKACVNEFKKKLGYS